jgi:predicted dehydrogenase
MKIAVIGCGSIGTRHVRNLIDLGFADFMVFDPSADRREQIAKELHLQTASALEQLWAFNPELTLITSPTSFHAEHARAILNNTKSHIFIEKPFAHELDVAKTLATLCEDSNRIIMVGCNFRFHTSIQRIQSLIRDRAVGDLLAARIEAGQYLPDWHPGVDYREMYSAKRSLGGGCLLDYIHEFDYANWLFGEPFEIASFHSTTGSLDLDTEDVAEVLVRFRPSVTVSIHVDYLQRPYNRRCKVVGTKGTILWDSEFRKVRLFDAEQRSWREFPEPADYDLHQMYRDELRYLVSAIRENSKVFSGPREALRALEIVNAAKKSQQDRVFVEI